MAINARGFPVIPAGPPLQDRRSPFDFYARPRNWFGAMSKPTDGARPVENSTQLFDYFAEGDYKLPSMLHQIPFSPRLTEFFICRNCCK